MQPGVTPGAVLELHAARANKGLSNGSNASANRAQWWDTSGSGNHGTLTNFAYTTASGWVTDPARLVLDGSNDYVACGDLSVAEDKTFTYEAWVVHSGAASGDVEGLIGEGNSASGNPFGAIYIGTYGAYAGHVGCRLRDDLGVDRNVFATGTTILNGAPHHIVGTCDGSLVQVYLDAAAIGTPDAPGGGSVTLNRATVGCRVRNVYEKYCSGSILVARIYPFALTPEQVAANFAAGYEWVDPLPNLGTKFR